MALSPFGLVWLSQPRIGKLIKLSNIIYIKACLIAILNILMKNDSFYYFYSESTFKKGVRLSQHALNVWKM